MCTIGTKKGLRHQKSINDIPDIRKIERQSDESEMSGASVREARSHDKPGVMPR